MPNIENALGYSLRTTLAAGVLTGGIGIEDGHIAHAQTDEENPAYSLIVDESIQDRGDASLASLGLTLEDTPLESFAARISSISEIPPVSTPNYEGYHQEDGTYIINVTRGNWQGAALAEVPGVYKDSSISIDGRLINNDENSRFLTFRTRWQYGVNSGYGTLIDTANNRFRIYKMVNGRDFTMLPWQYSDSITSDLNSLKFASVENMLTLVVNGKELASIVDDSGNYFPEGRTLFGIGGPQGTAEAIFDNLLIQDEIPQPEGTVLYDNFDDPSKGLFKQHENYIDGEFEIRNSNAQSGWMELTRRSFGDSVISVDARITQLGVGNPTQITLGCRYSGRGAYMLTVTPGLKFFAIDGWEDDRLHTLKNGNSNAILPGENHITLTCKGSKITVNINGVNLAEVSDTTYIFGSAFLGIGRAGTVRFDNFTISKD